MEEIGYYDYNYLFKYIIIGDTGVGKSCLVLRFTDDRYTQNHEFTIGVEFGAKMITCGDKKIKIQIWDTAGQETFRSITKSYYRNVSGAIVVYDITRRATFNNVRGWIKELKENNTSNCSILLIGNKTDIDMNRHVKYEEGEALAKEFDCDFIETSVKKDKNVKKAFNIITENILNKINNNIINVTNDNGIMERKIVIKTTKPKKSCCKI